MQAIPALNRLQASSYLERQSLLRDFRSVVGQPHSPPQPGFFRFAIDRATSHVTAMTTTTNAAMV